ncbi:MAG: ABC transporter permease [Thermoleophilaceae bacterium]|nr:ABC transporter permease [Thermoleophilaceae bacterium]
MEAANTPASDQPVTVIEPVRGWRLPDFREFWRYRDLLVVLARRDIVVRYKQAIFGPGWAVLQPLLVAGMFAFFLGIITDTTEILPDQDLPYGAFAVAGIVLWLAFATGVNMSALSTVMSSMLIEKVYFPRLMIPIAAVAPAAVDMVIGMFVAIAVAIGFGVVPDARVLLAPFVLLLALSLAVGLGIFLSALNVRYRDTTMLVNFVLLAGLFITPITYPYELFVSQFPAALEPIYALNPMVGVLELFRWCLLGTPLPNLAVLAVPFVAAPVFLVAGVLYFERSQRGFADVI